jgi:hypothetical protein
MATTSSFRTQAPAPIHTGKAGPVDRGYDYRVGGPEEQAYRRGYHRPQDTLSAQQRDLVYNRPLDLLSSTSQAVPEEDPHEAGLDDALLDLEQLEQLHQEAERMKALGNKHMAAQVRDGSQALPATCNTTCAVHFL